MKSAFLLFLLVLQSLNFVFSVPEENQAEVATRAVNRKSIKAEEEQRVRAGSLMGQKIANGEDCDFFCYPFCLFLWMGCNYYFFSDHGT